jgi:hypothetical protein
MSRKTEEKEIGGVTYAVTLLGARKGLEVATKLAPFLGVLAKAQKGGKEAATEALSEVLRSVSAADVQGLCDVMAEWTMVKGPGPRDQVILTNVFDDHFAGRYGDLLKWLGFCLSVNFPSFFSGAAPVKGSAAEATGQTPAP